MKMRHDAHYVESLTSFSGAAIGRMIPVDKIRPNPDQPRKALGDLRDLTDSIREKGVLEPLLVRFMPREDTHYIISGERRYHAARAAGLLELPTEDCHIRNGTDRSKTCSAGTALRGADGLYRLGTVFPIPKDIARKISKARSSVTETLSLRNIPDSLRRRCIERGINSRSLLLQIARQANEKKMAETVQRIVGGGLTRDEARKERREEKSAGPRPQPFVFNFQPEDESFRLRLQFRKSQVSREDLIGTLRGVLEYLEEDRPAAVDDPAVA
jgi:ParB family chromosome partitioning protein